MMSGSGSDRCSSLNKSSDSESKLPSFGGVDLSLKLGSTVYCKRLEISLMASGSGSDRCPSSNKYSDSEPKLEVSKEWIHR